MYPCSKRHVYQRLKSSIKSMVAQESIRPLYNRRFDVFISVGSTLMQACVTINLILNFKLCINEVLHVHKF